MPEFRFRLAIPSEQYLTHYQGAAGQVQVTLSDGRRLQFPAVNLREFVTHEGVYGSFVLHVDEQHKIQRLVRIGD